MANFFESNNPILGEETYQRSAQEAGYSRSVMTVDGAVNKSLILGTILVIAASIGWAAPNALFFWGGLIGGLVCAIASTFKPNWSPITAPLYAVFKGLCIGTISVIYGKLYHGIVFQALTLTIGLFFLMLFLYKGGFIRVTEKLRSGIMMATGAIFLVYALGWILSLFHIQIPLLYSASPIGIGISVVIIAVASLNLLLDFDLFEKGAHYGAPKYMEWYSALSLIITLVWLYIEILRLLSKLSKD